MSFKKENLEVLWTKDYEDFSFYERNRIVKDKGSESKIEASLVAHGWMKSHPMIVDGQLRIKDGQHRFLIAKKLGLEIPVLIVENFDDASMLAINNASKKWNSEDYLHYQAEKGDVVAQKLYKIVKETGLSVRTVFLAAHLSDGTLQNIDAKLKDVPFDKLNKKIKMVLEILDLIKLPKYVRLTVALVSMINNPNYNHRQMMNKLSYQLDKVHKCGNSANYVSLFQEIYNFKQVNKVVFDKNDY